MESIPCRFLLTVAQFFVFLLEGAEVTWQFCCERALFGMVSSRDPFQRLLVTSSIWGWTSVTGWITRYIHTPTKQGLGGSSPFQMAYIRLLNGGEPNHVILGWSSKYVLLPWSLIPPYLWFSMAGRHRAYRVCLPHLLHLLWAQCDFNWHGKDGAPKIVTNLFFSSISGSRFLQI